MNPLSKLQQIGSFLASPQKYEQMLMKSHQYYTFNEKDFRNLNHQSTIQHLISRLSESNGITEGRIASDDDLKEERGEVFWHPNEFKYFTWLSVCYAYITNCNILAFNQDDLCFIGSIFSSKKPIFITYSLRCLCKVVRLPKSGWYQQEIQMLLSIINKEATEGKWTDISFKLFDKSGGRYFRSSHKCREKWYNHLNPTVKHSKWSLQQDVHLFSLVLQMGQRWALISKAMRGARTEHMVKNRYNSLLRRYISRFQRSSAKKVNENILKNLRKKLEIELGQGLSAEQLVKCKMQEQQNCINGQSGDHTEPAKDNIDNCLHLMPIWECQQKIQNYFQQESMKIQLNEKFQLIDYCLLDLDFDYSKSQFIQ